ncbi:MAG: UPF0262 family protein [Rhodobacteraceae bacterium]|nr:UPF0262 family protein [Paracoccaceae bacterium]
MSQGNYLLKVEIDTQNGPLISPEMQQEQRVAIYDLLASNSFCLLNKSGEENKDGPYQLYVSINSGRLSFNIASSEGEQLAEFQLSLTPFRDLIKTYFRICDLYYDAVKKHTRSRIETIDMTRRNIHDEGAELLRQRLKGKVIFDRDTARRLFTLVCVLQVKR